MPTEVIMPKVDMDMATGRISRWFKKDGEAVAKGELLFEIETDKATMEIDAPSAGVLGDVTGGEGVDIPVGQPVAWIYADGESRAPAAEAPAEVAAPAIAVEPVGSPAPVKATDLPKVPAPSLAEPGEAVRATPLARRLARQRGIDLSALTGSGPRGRIQARDVEALPEARSSAVAEARPATADSRGLPPAVQSATRAATWLRREGDGHPLVLIHGFGSETAGWRPFLSAFDRAMPILSVDLPGHGAAVDATASGFDDLTAHVEQQLVAEGITAAHLAGHSLGGAVAIAVAAGTAVETRSLFLIAPAGLGPDINSAFTEGFANARDEAPVRMWLNELVADPAVLSDGFIRATARQRVDGRLPEAQSRVAPRLFSHGTQHFSVRGQFERLPVRTRIVAGTMDRVIPAHHFARLPGRVALHLFAGLGHMPHIEDKASVAALLADHVR